MSDQLLLAMLEDDEDRLTRFRAILAHKSPSVTLHAWPSAHDFIREFPSLEFSPSLISLDHDLVPLNPGDPDPGDGRQVAAFLAARSPCCPVLIHSSNAWAADSMYFTLLDTGWNVALTAPIGDDWIESYWFPTARQHLKRIN